MNRNSKKLPKQEINAIKSKGKRLRNGYALVKLKRWGKKYDSSVEKSEGEKSSKYSIDRTKLKRVKRLSQARKRKLAMIETRKKWLQPKENKASALKRSERKTVESVDRKIKSTPSVSKVKKERKSNAPSVPVIPPIMHSRKERAERKSVESVDRKIKSTPSVSKVKKWRKSDAPSVPVIPPIMHSRKERAERKSVESVDRKIKSTPSVSKVKKERKSNAPSEPVISPIMHSRKERAERKSVESVDRKIKSTPDEFNSDVFQELKNYVKYIYQGKFLEDKWNFKSPLNTFAKIDEQNNKIINYDELIINILSINGELDNSATENRREEFIKDLAIYLVICSQNIMGYKAHKTIQNIVKKLQVKEVENLNCFTIVYDEPDSYKINTSNKLNLDEFIKFIPKFAGDDVYKRALMGIYYEKVDNAIVITDAFKLIILPQKYLSDSIVNRLEDQKIHALGLKDYKNFEIIHQNYPPYKNIIQDDSNLKTIGTIYIDNELEKIKQLKVWKRFNDTLAIRRAFTKIDVNYNVWSFNYTYYEDILTGLKALGKNVIELKMSLDEDWIRRGIYLLADDIKVIFMPIKYDEIIAIDTKLYNFNTGSMNNGYDLPKDYFISGIAPSEQNALKYLEKMTNALSDDNSQPALFDDISPNVNAGKEIEEIGKDIPAFGDDITEEKIELDEKYNLPDVNVKRDNMDIASARDIRSMKFKSLNLPSKYKNLLGKVPENFRLLLWGAPGHGKSSLALTIANDIGKKVKTLFVSAEESLESATLSSRIKRFSANAKNLMFNDSNNPDIIEKIILTFNPKFIVIDSVNVMLGKTEAIINLMLKYPEIGFIIIAQATKDQKRYAGLGALAHAVDIVVNVKSGVATAEKNRYSQLGSMPVKGIKI